MLTLVLNMIATVLCTGTVTYAVNRHRIGAGRVLCIVVMSVLSGMFVYGCFTDLVKTLQIAACIAGCFLPVYGAVRLRAETAASEKRRARKRTRALLKRLSCLRACELTDTACSVMAATLEGELKYLITVIDKLPPCEDKPEYVNNYLDSAAEIVAMIERLNLKMNLRLIDNTVQLQTEIEEAMQDMHKVFAAAC